MAFTNITTDYGINYGRTGGKRTPTGWYVYSEATAKAVAVHTVYTTREEAIEQAHFEQAQHDKRNVKAAAEAPAQAIAAAETIVRDAAADDLATDRQVDYIMTLLRQGRADEGGFYSGPTSREGVERMTRASASAYITSLTGRY